MTDTGSRILTLNAGSSGIKFNVYSALEKPVCLQQGALNWQHLPELKLQLRNGSSSAAHTSILPAPDRTAAMQVLMDWISQAHSSAAFTAVGHRIVHGGPDLHRPQLLNPELIATLLSLERLDPEHVPQETALIKAVAARFPDLPQIACFDTAFHHHLPRVAQQLAVPRRFEARGVKRYGFHGLSYAWLMEELRRQAGTVAAEGRIILAHIGNGVSLAAVKAAKVMDTTMAFSPAAGVCMGTRTGDIDPGLVAWLLNSAGLSAQQFNHLVNFESGLLGISETSADMQTLLALETQDVRAAEAVALFCYQIKKTIGAYAAVLGGVDTLVFAGGIGENAPVIRSRICNGLDFLGLQLDETLNSSNASVISSPGLPAVIRMIPTDEAQMIARDVWQMLQQNHPAPEQHSPLEPGPQPGSVLKE